MSGVTKSCRKRAEGCSLRKTVVPFPLFLIPLRCLRLVAAAQILSRNSLALLIPSLPDAAAQQNPARNPAKDIVTSGIGLGNKTPRGIWVDEGKQVMLVLDFRHKKIFTYCLDTGRRLDNHHNDRVSATATDLETTAKKAAVNEDDFFLFKNKASATGEKTAAEVMDGWLKEPYQDKGGRKEGLLLPNPYGIWADGTTDTSTLWDSDFDDDKKSTFLESKMKTMKIWEMMITLAVAGIQAQSGTLEIFATPN